MAKLTNIENAEFRELADAAAAEAAAAEVERVRKQALSARNMNRARNQDGGMPAMQDPTGNEAKGTALTSVTGPLPITDYTVREAESRCQKYWDKMKMLENRLIENERYYRQQYTRMKTETEKKSLPERGSAYLLNAINNKLADAMDNYPQPTILAREESDEDMASILSKVVPVILNRNNFERVYYEAQLEKIKDGFCVYGIFWNPLKDNIGEVEVKRIDPLNMRWEPGINSIQESKEVFILQEYDTTTLRDTYPEILGNMSGGITMSELSHYDSDDDLNLSEKTIVYDWYYKKTVGVEIAGQTFPKTVLHYCKFCNGKVLYASENDERMAGGWYEDSLYPFVFDVMFPVKDAPYGFGYIDMMREPQEYIDKLDFAIMQNALAASRPRWFAKDGADISEDEYADFTKAFVHYTGNPDDIKPITAAELPSIYVETLENKKEELKENSGNRDFSQGATTGGVTAASAIAALQEASSKTSRAMNMMSYNSFKDMVEMVINRMQQFYTVPRTYRIILDNKTYYQMVGIGQNGTPENENMAELVPGSVFDETLGHFAGGRKPIYDIQVGAEKSSPYSRIAQNEFAKELFNIGAFNPQLADQVLPMLRMMDFDDKDEIIQEVSKNQQMFLKLQQLTALVQGLGPIIAETTGDTRIMDMFPDANEAAPEPGSGAEGKTLSTNQLGETTKEDENSQAAKMREETNNRAAVGGAK